MRLEGDRDRPWRADALLGDAYVVTGDPATAATAYQRAIARSDRPVPGLRVTLARLLHDELQQSEAAARAWTAYLEHHAADPDAAEAHLFLGEHALRHDDPLAAEAHLRQLLDHHHAHPATTVAIAHLGALWVAQERWHDAELALAPYEDASGDRGEAAAVVLLRVDLALGRLARLRRRLQRYDARFPHGRRAHEVARIRAALAGR